MLFFHNFNSLPPADWLFNLEGRRLSYPSSSCSLGCGQTKSFGNLCADDGPENGWFVRVFELPLLSDSNCTKI